MHKPVIALPGGVMPAAFRYAPLRSALGDEVELHTTDLEVYAGDSPPPGYSIETEVAALARFADSLSAQQFHLIGYSGGGFVSLAFAAAYPERLLSLAVFEPARVPGNLTSEEAELDRSLRQALAGAEGAKFMEAFVTLQVRPGVVVPPPQGPPAPWMRNRPAGLAAMMQAFGEYRFDRNQLRGCYFPTYFAYGNLSSEMEEMKAAVLGRLLPDIHIRRFDGVHHFVPPEQIYTAELIQDLRELWVRAERQAGLPREAAVRAGV